jgi:hypothetical protein
MAVAIMTANTSTPITVQNTPGEPDEPSAVIGSPALAIASTTASNPTPSGGRAPSRRADICAATHTAGMVPIRLNEARAMW